MAHDNWVVMFRLYPIYSQVNSLHCATLPPYKHTPYARRGEQLLM